MRRRAHDMATVARENGITYTTRYERNHQIPHGHATAPNGDDCSFAIDDEDDQFRWRPLAGFGSMERKNRKKVEAWLDLRANRFKVYKEWSRLRASAKRKEVAEERSLRRKHRDSLRYRSGDALWNVPDRRYRNRRVVDAEWVGGYRLRLKFGDGAEGILDMTEDVERFPSMYMEWFLEDPRLFREVYVDTEERGVLRWPDMAFEMSPLDAYERCMENDGLAFADEWWKQPPYSDYD